MLGTTSFEDFEAVLIKLGAKLEARNVHALYLGALTSTDFRLGPQRLLNRIFGDEPVLGGSIEDANAALQVLFGYWNALVTERDRGRVRLAPAHVPSQPTREDLCAFAKGRDEEIRWFVRGIDAGGDDPIELGPEGAPLLEGIAKASGYLSAYVDPLGRDEPAETNELAKTRAMLLEIVATVERLIADLMAVSDAVRRAAIETFTSNAGRPTDDGARIAGRVKIGRNAACPCRSGKKYKKCCGAASTVQ